MENLLSGEVRELFDNPGSFLERLISAAETLFFVSKNIKLWEDPFKKVFVGRNWFRYSASWDSERILHLPN